MKAAVTAGALAIAFWGSAALAHGKDCPDKNTQASSEQSSSMSGTGGSASVGTSSSDLNTSDQSVTTSNQTTTEESAGVGGSGQTAMTPSETTAAPSVDTNTAAETTTPAYAQPVVVEKKDEDKAKMRGVTVQLNGGVEGYTGDVNRSVKPGPSYGVNLDLRPSKVLGIELGYTGAVNEFRNTGDVNGADIVRNGGQALLTLGLGAAPVQPYILGGVGVHRYNVRGTNVLGFKDDTNGAIPVGAGLRTHIGHFTADARLDYNFIFSQDFAPTADTMNLLGLDATNAGRYQGLVQIGSTF